MSQEYNSKLISRLYKSRNLTDVLDEVKNVIEPIFIEPLLDAYLRTKNDDCLFALNAIKSNELVEIVQEKLGDIRQYKGDIPEIIDIFNSNKTYTIEVSDIAGELLRDFFSFTQKEFDDKWGYFGSYGLERTLEYLKGAQKIDEYDSILDYIFFQGNMGKEYDRVILKYFIRIKPGEKMSMFIERYLDFKKTDKELVLSEELVGWKNGHVPELKKIIINNGSSRAREILEQEDAKNKKIMEDENKKTVEEQRIVFQNNQILQNIYDVRKSINIKSLAKEDFKFELLESSEILWRQAKVATSEAELRDYCVDMRDTIKNINTKVNGHGFTDDKAIELIPGASKETIGGSVNQLALFLISRNKSVDLGLWGLRDLMHLVNLLAAHPNDMNDLISVLKKENLYTKYNDKKWGEMHGEMLIKYLNFLKKLDSGLEK